jgi:putative hydrolase of the HAD superfamily
MRALTWCLMLDVDGVVIGPCQGDGRPWSADIERDLGIAPQALRSRFFAPYWEDIVTGRENLADVLGRCLPDLAPHVTVSELIDYWFARDSAVNSYVLEQCAALRRRGVGVFLTTNQEHLRASYLMETLALRQHVDGMVYSAELGARKPAQAFFDLARRRIGLPGERLLLVDDTLANVEAARAAGWQAAPWTRSSNLCELSERIFPG